VIACVLLASTSWPQDTELIPEAYLAARYLAPLDAPSNTLIAGTDERGDRLIVSGRALDEDRPVAGVSTYAFHADVGADGDTSSLDTRTRRRSTAALCESQLLRMGCSIG
jgi:hypothetical protein